MENNSQNNQVFSVLDLLLKEAQNYDNFKDLEKLVEKGVALKHLPIQPLYLSLREMRPDEIGQYLPLFDQSQRKSFLDLDLWEKDDIDINSFSYWVMAYHSCPDEQVKLEFVKSHEFLLYLKNAFNIWTFDVEDPEYPDHDNYFLTEDQQLLFEYHQELAEAFEIKDLIKLLYSDLGVDKAYQFLFKVISDSMMELQEEEYQYKKGRLEEFGFVDYYDSLLTENTFPNINALNFYLKNKKKFKVSSCDEIGKFQGLHSSTVQVFRGRIDILSQELLKVKDQERNDFLHFNFIRLVNSRISFHMALKEGRTAIHSATRNCSDLMLLGFDYVRDLLQGQIEEKGIFDLFDFFDLYKVGHSLIYYHQKDIKKSLRSFQMEEVEKQFFLGSYLNDFLDALFDSPSKMPGRKVGEKNQSVLNMATYRLQKKEADTFLKLLPFIVKFQDLYLKLKEEGKIQDHFYFNTKVDEIDFESFILSAFVLFVISQKQKDFSKKLSTEHKLGVTIEEFKTFLSLLKKEPPEEQGKLFAQSYGLETDYFLPYLQNLLQNHLEGYDWETMAEADFKHVGGPILLTPGRP